MANRGRRKKFPECFFSENTPRSVLGWVNNGRVGGEILIVDDLFDEIVFRIVNDV